MKKFNAAVKQYLESNTVGGVMGVAGGVYAAGDNRPIEPARIVLGAKIKKKKNKKEPDQQMISVPVQRRSRAMDNIAFSSK